MATKISTKQTSAAMATVIWKLRASLASLATCSDSLPLVSQITNGPTTLPKGKRNPSSAERWANMPQLVSSLLSGLFNWLLSMASLPVMM